MCFIFSIYISLLFIEEKQIEFRRKYKRCPDMCTLQSIWGAKRWFKNRPAISNDHVTINESSSRKTWQWQIMEWSILIHTCACGSMESCNGFAKLRIYTVEALQSYTVWPLIYSSGGAIMIIWTKGWNHCFFLWLFDIFNRKSIKSTTYCVCTRKVTRSQYMFPVSCAYNHYPTTHISIKYILLFQQVLYVAWVNFSQIISGILSWFQINFH